MTIFSTFSGQFSKSDITLFSDFFSGTAPFNTALSNGSATSAFTSVNSSGTFGVLNVGVSSTITSGIFPFSGVYMSGPQTSAGAAINRDFALGRGEVEVSAKVQRTSAAGASVICSVGVSSANYDTSTVPAQNFAGFFTVGTTQKWSYGVVVAGVKTEIVTKIDVSDLHEFSVIVSKDARLVSFYADGVPLGALQTNLSSASVIPAAEVKDTTSGGGGTTTTMSLDWMLVRLRTSR